MYSVTGETSISPAPTASLWDYGINKFSFTAIHFIMLELKNIKHNTYYRCTSVHNKGSYF